MSAARRELERLLCQAIYLMLYKLKSRCLLTTAILLSITAMFLYCGYYGEIHRVQHTVNQVTKKECLATLEIQVQTQHPENDSKPTIMLQQTSNELETDLSISRTLRNIEKCMQASNLTSTELVHIAKQNAETFMKKYREVIPVEYMSDHSSHCWKTDYCISSDGYHRVRGHIGNTTFNSQVSKCWFGHNMWKDLEAHFSGHFHSSKVCLPNLYLLGFEKSGSTFFWCVLSKLLNNRHECPRLQADKEPYFWTPFSYKVSPPDPGDLGSNYLPMFMRAFNPTSSSEAQKNITLIDGCPSTVIEWPRFNTDDPDMANYCLLPSAMPELFPRSKYIVIMRNPISMLYSAFWWSFHKRAPKNDLAAKEVSTDHSKGPEAFHYKVGRKIVQFLRCLNQHPSTKAVSKCTLWGTRASNYSQCVRGHVHLLTECVANITNQREFLEAVIHRGIYYVHVRKWLQTVARDRIFFTTMEQLTTNTYSTARQAYKFIQGSSDAEIDEQDASVIANSCRENKNIVNYKNNPELAMRRETKILLEKFFEPFNKMLAELLGDEQFLWQQGR